MSSKANLFNYMYISGGLWQKGLDKWNGHFPHVPGTAISLATAFFFVDLE